MLVKMVYVLPMYSLSCSVWAGFLPGPHSFYWQSLLALLSHIYFSHLPLFSAPHCHHCSPSLLCRAWILHVKFLVHSEYSMKDRQKMFIVNWRKCDTSIWSNISWFKHFKDSLLPLRKKSNFLLRPTALASAQPPTSPNDACMPSCDGTPATLAFFIFRTHEASPLLPQGLHACCSFCSECPAPCLHLASLLSAFRF